MTHRFKLLLEWAEESLLFDELNQFIIWFGRVSFPYSLYEKISEEEFKPILQSYEQYKKGLEN